MKNDSSPHYYPEHIYDPLRRAIATSMLEKEFKKKFRSAMSDIDIKTWAAQLDAPMFWNSVEGFMGGMLLKPIVHFLTADNYTWSKREVNVADIQLSSKLEQLNAIKGLDDQKLLLLDIAEKLSGDSSAWEEQKSIVESFSKDETQDAYPVLIVEKDGRPMVMDGNRRCLQAVLEHQETIEAWYCQTNGQQPHNFWYPVDDMLRLVKVYQVGKDENPQLKRDMQGVLQAIFTRSNVAERAYKHRILEHGVPGAEDLL